MSRWKLPKFWKSKKKNHLPKGGRMEYRSELDSKRFGISLDDVNPLMRDDAVWGIDESGTPILSAKSSDYLTLAAVTFVGGDSYDDIIRWVTLCEGELKFSFLSHNHPAQCWIVSNRIGNSNVLILYIPKYKHDVTGTTHKEFYRAAASELIQTIKALDLSDNVRIEYDRNDWLDKSYYDAISDDRVKVVPVDSKESRHVQIADMSAGALQHAMLPPDKGSKRYLKRLWKKSVNMSEGPDMRTQHIPYGLTSDETISSEEDKKASKNRKPKGKRKPVSDPGCTQQRRCNTKSGRRMPGKGTQRTPIGLTPTKSKSRKTDKNVSKKTKKGGHRS